MNKKDINTFGQALYCYRVKTKRKKIREIKEANEKKLIKLDKELENIRQQQRNIGYVDLNPPVMRGWKRYFILRDDVAKSKEAMFYRNLLEKINTTSYSNRKDFKKRRHWRAKKNRVHAEQSLLQPYEWQLQKLKFSEKEFALFDQVWVRGNSRNEWFKQWIFKEPWRFILRIRPNLITKIKVVSIALEKREKEIGDFLEQNDKWGTLSRLKGNSVNKWRKLDCGLKRQYRFKKKTLREILGDNEPVNGGY